jgi:type I site-specific restriction endonuclease
MRLASEAQLLRFDEEQAELLAAVEARRTRVEEMRLESEVQLRQFNEQQAKLEATIKAQQAEAEELRIAAELRLSLAEDRSRTEQEQFEVQTARLERVADEVAQRRAEVEALFHKTNEEDRRLVEMQQALQQSRPPASAGPLWLEPEFCQQTDHDLLDEAVGAPQATAQLADIPEEEIDLRSLESEQKEPIGKRIRKRKYAVVSRVG